MLARGRLVPVRPSRGARQPAVSPGRGPRVTRAISRIASWVIGSRTSCTCAIPSRANPRSASASAAGSLSSGGIAACAVEPWSRPAPPGRRTSAATVRSTSAGSRPTSRQASSTRSRRRTTPATSLPVSLYQAFHESAWAMVARSIRGPIEPIISGGPAGRGPRGRSSQSRTWYQLPVEVDGTVAQERPDDRERLLEPVDAVVVRVAEGAELRLVPARAQAEDEPPAADLVDRGGLLGQQRGVVEVRAGDQWPELDAGRRGRDRRQQRPCLPRPTGRPVGPAVQQVLADPDRIEAEILDRADHVEQLGPADLALDFGELDADLEWPARGRGCHDRNVAGATGRPLTRNARITHPAHDMTTALPTTRQNQGPERAT